MTEKRFLIYINLIGGIIFGLGMIIFRPYLGVKSIILGIIAGLLFGGTFYLCTLLMTSYRNSPKRLINSPSLLNPNNEQTIYSNFIILKSGNINLAGRITVFETTIQFQAYNPNFLKDTLVINLRDIKSFRTFNLDKLFPTGFEIIKTDNEFIAFISVQRRMIIEIIKKQIEKLKQNNFIE